MHEARGRVDGSPLVAHRGLPFRFPENSLSGFEAALHAGARWCETDVQLTADGVPVLFHDLQTTRLSGLPGTITNWSMNQLQLLGVSHPERFGGRFRGNPATTLRQLCQLFQAFPAAQLFVELKTESEAAFGAEEFARAVGRVIAESSLQDRVVLISFSQSLLQQAASIGHIRTGWVTARWNDDTASYVHRSKPDYLFLDHHLATATQEPPANSSGNWQTVWYTINDDDTARRFLRHGPYLLETDRFDELCERL